MIIIFKVDRVPQMTVYGMIIMHSIVRVQLCHMIIMWSINRVLQIYRVTQNALTIDCRGPFCILTFLRFILNNRFGKKNVAWYHIQNSAWLLEKCIVVSYFPNRQQKRTSTEFSSAYCADYQAEQLWYSGRQVVYYSCIHWITFWDPKINLLYCLSIHVPKPYNCRHLYAV